MTKSFTTPTNTLIKLENLFIELTAHNCNQHCRHCYIDFPLKRNIQDFISLDKVTNALEDLKKESVKIIYLTGAEPMLHPNFNAILRACLKKTSVCICTNGSLINEKKARFLKKVEDESDYEIIFKLSIDHFDEIKNDNIRYRGAYRQTINAIKSLIKYDFTPVIAVTNYYKEDNQTLINNFSDIFSKIGFNITKDNLQINYYHDRYSEQNTALERSDNLDCNWGRILTVKGVYTCPFLANDYRGYSGSDFKVYSAKNTLESEYCQTCMKTGGTLFGLSRKIMAAEYTKSI